MILKVKVVEAVVHVISLACFTGIAQRM